MAPIQKLRMKPPRPCRCGLKREMEMPEAVTIAWLAVAVFAIVVVYLVIEEVWELVKLIRQNWKE